MKDSQIDPRTLISTLWVFILFNIVFRDLHQFLNPEAMQEMLRLRFKETEVLLFGILLEVPILLLLLTRILPLSTSKWLNTSGAIISIIGIATTFPTADLDDKFFASIEFCALIGIIFFSWKSYSPLKISESIKE